MPNRYLVGPVPQSAGDFLPGNCLTFGPAGADLVIGRDAAWEAILALLPGDWRPDCVVLDLAAGAIPQGLWTVPAPLVALARDWGIRWHLYRRLLPRCELALADPDGVEVMTREGFRHARVGNSIGVGPPLEEAAPEANRDVDLLMAGGLHPAAQKGRLRWLARLARWSDHWRVAVHRGNDLEGYRPLLRRARIAFCPHCPGDDGRLALEAAAAGALVVRESGDRAADCLRDGQECIHFTEDDLEPLLEKYLADEESRRALADAARNRVRECVGSLGWQGVQAAIEAEWPELQTRVAGRPGWDPLDRLLARTWQALHDPDPPDASLTQDLAAAPPSAALHCALGAATALAAPQSDRKLQVAEAAAEHFGRALDADPGFVLAALFRAEALSAAGRRQPAVEQARRALELLDRGGTLDGLKGDIPPFPTGLTHFRAEWERAAWKNAGNPGGERKAKRRLIRWRLHGLLAKETGSLPHRYEAALARPDLPSTRAALGAALLQAGCAAEAVPHLRRALEANPLDSTTARVHFEALGSLGQPDEQARFAGERRLLARAAHPLVADEPWTYAAVPAAPSLPAAPAIRRRVSLCMIVKDEEANLPDCLASTADLVDEIIVVDTGSTDRTKEVAASFGAKVFDFPWCDSFAEARNESLKHASGDWVFWPDADDRLDEDNRRKLKTLLAGLPDADAAYLLRQWSVPDAVSGAVAVVDQAKLFRLRPDVRFEYRVHEQILPAVLRRGGTVRPTDIVFRHVGYHDPALKKRKLERNLRLLRMQDAERPDDPFTLYNLGGVCLDLHDVEAAAALFRRTLERSPPGYTLTPKTYALLTQCLRQAGRPDEALKVCREGRGRFPGDAELLFHEGLLHQDRGEAGAAEARWLAVLAAPANPSFACTDVGLQGHKTRHHLALLYRRQKRLGEAEAQWREALAERPDFVPGWVGLGEMLLGQGRQAEWEQAAVRLEADPETSETADVIRGWRRLAEKDYAEARRLLEQAAGGTHALWRGELLAQALEAEGRDPAAAARAWQDVLVLDPHHGLAHRRLERLGRKVNGAPA
jgi:tetratricopeptide (TPR) repeat protein